MSRVQRVWIVIYLMSAAELPCGIAQDLAEPGPLPGDVDSATSDRSDGASPAATLGRRIFLDTGLSRPRGQACVSCHAPAAAFADPRQVSPGAVSGRAGRRNAPSLMYAALIPGRAFDEFVTAEGEEQFAWEGGLFLDGRARDLFEQVQQPFLDCREMNLPDERALAVRLRESDYATEFRQWVGPDIWENDRQLTFHAFRALVEFLREPLFRPFDARIDDFLAGDAAALTPAERRGLAVYRGAGRCADCHPLEPRTWPQPLLSDFGFDNLGVPSRGEADAGLGAHTGDPQDAGRFRAPSLRNVALTAPYMHNGSLPTLRDVMEFYNKRDRERQRWGATDFPETVNREDLGNLGLSDQEVTDLIALMQAFTDRTLLASEVQDGNAFPPPRPGTPSTDELRLRFPDWTHRLHPAFPGVTEERR